ncbi:uncharacterized protein LOC129723293 isoform X2 [Wyeomyia smithii]|nr:uncharacterized protein LOC129723293 isoform X2 [Wyeomyia smithii]XP_055533400.1 uncharacterized protein LOC129723293 isoform X2 [Wyeomyia smithii]
MNPLSTEGEVKITQDTSDEDIPIEDILAVNYDVGVTENGNLRDKATLTDIVSTVSVAVQCRAVMVSKEVQTSRALNFHQKLMTSPRHTSVCPLGHTCSSLLTSSSLAPTSASSEYIPNHQSDLEFEAELNRTENKFRYVAFSNKLMKKHPMRYLGVPDDSLYVLDAVAEATKLSERDIMIVLRKIRMNESFDILSDVFGLSCSRISQIFNNSVPIIAAEMRELMFWPMSENIKKFLPVAFLQNYSNVESIIDCFEIQVQKSSYPVIQSVTYSLYKSCNTVKYLVSCTPCGLINFISKGFPGRASDQKIVNKSGYLNRIRPGMGVLADRGFKNVASDVAKKGGILIRPPSVSNEASLSKEDAIHAKEIASVRIHVERLIRRYREYSMAASHAELPILFFDKLDDIIDIITGAVNLQSKLIK